MNVPFTVEQFLQVFKNYNLAVWPMQIVFYLLGFAMVYLAFRKSKKTDVVISVILAFLWFWMGLIYHLGFFTSINKAAWIFGAFNILQGFVILYYGVLKSRLTFAYNRDVSGVFGLTVIAYALVVYPVIGYFAGHAYPYAPTFGLPCPTTIFTLGMVLMASCRVPAAILVIPLLWSMIGTSAALSFGIVEDAGLLISGVTATLLVVYRNRKFYSARLSQ
jgi:hypothetical protein